MICGVIIDGANTLTEYGLALGADLSIGVAAPKTTWINIPEANGALNMSYALTNGEPVYQMRNVSFTLIGTTDPATGRRMTAERFYELARAFAGATLGREVKLITPDDGNHYFKGVLSLGQIKKYNHLTLPVSVRCYPLRYKNDETTILESIPGTGTRTFYVDNEEQPAVPTITVSDACALTFGDETYSLTTGENHISGIRLKKGRNTMTLTGDYRTTFRMTWQEAVLV